MKPESKQEGVSQVVGDKPPISGSKVGKTRIKARHLTPISRQLVLDMFDALRSTEEVAAEVGIPARTVTDVLLLAVLRKGPQPERGVLLPMRRVG